MRKAQRRGRANPLAVQPDQGDQGTPQNGLGLSKTQLKNQLDYLLAIELFAFFAASHNAANSGNPL